MWNDVKCNFILIFHGGHTSLVHNYQQWIRFHSGTRRLGALQALSETWNINGQLFFLLIENCGLVYMMGILWWQNAIELGYDMIWYDMTWYGMSTLRKNWTEPKFEPKTSPNVQKTSSTLLSLPGSWFQVERARWTARTLWTQSASPFWAGRILGTTCTMLLHVARCMFQKT